MGLVGYRVNPPPPARLLHFPCNFVGPLLQVTSFFSAKGQGGVTEDPRRKLVEIVECLCAWRRSGWLGSRWGGLEPSQLRPQLLPGKGEMPKKGSQKGLRLKLGRYLVSWGGGQADFQPTTPVLSCNEDGND